MPHYFGQADYTHGSPVAAGVLLVNLGTPQAPTRRAVRRYLAEFLADPRIVEAPALALVACAPRRDPARAAGAIGATLREDLDATGLAASDRHPGSGGKSAELAETAAARADPRPLRDALRQAVDRIGPARARGSRRTATARAAALSAVFRHDGRIGARRGRRRACRAGVGCRSCASSPTTTPNRATSKRSHEASKHIGRAIAAHSGCCSRSTAFRNAISARAIRISANARRRHGRCASGWIFARTNSSVAFQSRVGREAWLAPYTDRSLEGVAEAGRPPGAGALSRVCGRLSGNARGNRADEPRAAFWRRAASASSTSPRSTRRRITSPHFPNSSCATAKAGPSSIRPGTAHAPPRSARPRAVARNACAMARADEIRIELADRTLAAQVWGDPRCRR